MWGWLPDPQHHFWGNPPNARASECQGRIELEGLMTKQCIGSQPDMDGACASCTTGGGHVWAVWARNGAIGQA